MLRRVLHRIGYVDLVADDVDAVRSEARWKVGIGERTLQTCQIELLVENFDLAAAKIERWVYDGMKDDADFKAHKDDWAVDQQGGLHQ